MLLSRGRIGIENANNVNKLPPVGATVLIMALPMKGGSGSPARIVAFWDTNLPMFSSSDELGALKGFHCMLAMMIALCLNLPWAFT